MYTNLCKIFIDTSVSEAGLQFDVHMFQEAVSGVKVPCSSTSEASLHMCVCVCDEHL